MNETIKSKKLRKESRERLIKGEESLKEMQKILDRFKKKDFYIQQPSADRWEIIRGYYT